ncbi:MAG: ABC transporter ATP-binding protein, partial [Sphaerochaetaceae bacterium]
SGGERRRLHLISTLVSNPNFLVFDECTNDLDIATIRTLEDYIESFSGCVVLVSHDRAFMDRVCSELFCFQEDGRIVRYEGTCSEYLEELTRQQQPRQEAPKEAPAPQKAKKGLSYKEQKRFEQVEETIAEKEDEKAEIEAFFSSGSIDSDGSKSRQYKEVCDLLESLYAEWEELGSRA